MARTKLNVRWDEVKPGDLIEHPWPSYRYLVGSLVEVTSVDIVGSLVKFSTPAGGDSRPAASMIEVMREEMTVDDVRALLRSNASPDLAILLDDGEYYVEAESAESGLLLRVCDMALLEEDDAECHGGYNLSREGVWKANFCVKLDPDAEELHNYAVECDDREHAIAVLWLMRSKTVGYRTGEQ